MNGPDGEPRPLIILDATAHLDPRYRLAGQFDCEQLPTADFQNTTIVLTSDETVTKGKFRARWAEEVVEQFADHLQRAGVCSESKVLLEGDPQFDRHRHQHDRTDGFVSPRGPELCARAAC